MPVVEVRFCPNKKGGVNWSLQSLERILGFAGEQKTEVGARRYVIKHNFHIDPSTFTMPISLEKARYFRDFLAVWKTKRKIEACRELAPCRKLWVFLFFSS